MTDKTVEEQPTQKHVVLYTDGGCKPSRGLGGFGIHGYAYINEVPKQGYGIPYVLTDKGYAEKEKDIVGITVLNYIDVISVIDGETTNNVTEIRAVIHAIELSLEEEYASITILSDSKYVQQGLKEWIHNWIKNDWIKSDGQEVSNKADWLRLLELRDTLKEKDIKLKIIKVKGHSGDLGNDAADSNASKAVVIAHKGLSHYEKNMTEPKGYWSVKNDYNRMISKKCLYFVTNQEVGKSLDGRTVYHMGNHGADNHLMAKAMSDVSYSVVFIKEPDPVIEQVRDYQNSVTNGVDNRVIFGNLSAIMQPKHYNQVMQHGSLFLKTADNSISLSDQNNVVYTEEQRPARLAFRGIEMLLGLQSKLEEYLDQVKTGEGSLVITPITDELYDITKNKKDVDVYSIKPTIDSSVKSIKFDLSYDTKEHQGSAVTTVLMELDMPSRNTLSAIKGSKPKVTMITWRNSDTSFRYACIVETEDGDVGIWSSVYGNMRVLMKKDIK